MSKNLLITLLMSFTILGCKNELSVNYDLTDQQRKQILEIIDNTLGENSLVYNFYNNKMYISELGMVLPLDNYKVNYPGEELVNEFTFKKLQVEYSDNNKTYSGFEFETGNYKSKFARLDEIVVNEECMVVSVEMRVVRFPYSYPVIPYIEDIVLKNTSDLDGHRVNAGYIHTKDQGFGDSTLHFFETIAPKTMADKNIHDELFDRFSDVVKDYCEIKK